MKGLDLDFSEFCSATLFSSPFEEKESNFNKNDVLILQVPGFLSICMREAINLPYCVGAN